jgi:putative redox protein
MVEIRLNYQGDLRCRAVHVPSGSEILTDAPVDNHGKGAAFSPTDLLAAALASCTMTVIGIVAGRKGIVLDGMEASVRKFMSAEAPRRVSRLELDLALPLPPDHPDRPLLEGAARSCPVHHSIHPDIEVVVAWDWRG